MNNILITENGLPSISPDLYDMKRLNYIKNNLEQVFNTSRKSLRDGLLRRDGIDMSVLCILFSGTPCIKRWNSRDGVYCLVHDGQLRVD